MLLTQTQKPKKYRACHGANVYLLSHRIDAVSCRNFPYNAKKRRNLKDTLVQNDLNSVEYVVKYGRWTKWTGVIYIAHNKNQYVAHHTDVVRV